MVQVLLRSSDNNIQAWIDHKPAIDIFYGGCKFSIRAGRIKISARLDITSYSTTGALRKLEYRRIAPPADDAK
jgi:hypothetical protein